MTAELHELVDAGGGLVRVATPEVGHCRIDAPGGGYLLLTPELALQLAGLLEAWYQRHAPEPAALDEWARGTGPTRRTT